MRVLYDEAGGSAGAAAGGAPGSNPLAGGEKKVESGKPVGGETVAAAAPAELGADWDFKSYLPADLKDNPAFAKITVKGKEGIEALARAHAHAQQFIGKDAARLVEIPENLTPETRRDILERLGASKDPASYKLTPMKDAPEWAGVEYPMAKEFLKMAHVEGIPPDTTQKIYEGYVGFMKAEMQAVTAKMVETDTKHVESLKQEWGDAFDGNVRAANFAIEKLGGDPLREAINSANLGAHPAVVKALAQVGKLYAESSGGGDKGGGGFGGGMTPAEAKAKGVELLHQSMKTKDQFEQQKLQEEAQKFFKIASR